MVRKIVLLIVVIVFLVISFNRAKTLFSSDRVSLEGEKILSGQILGIPDEETVVRDNREYVSQNIRFQVESGEEKGRIIDLRSSLTPKYDVYKYKEGDDLLVGYIGSGEEDEYFYIIGYSRTKPLLVLMGIFILLTVLVVRRKGLYSLLGMAVSLLILFLYILPFISDGLNPFLVTIGGIAGIVPCMFYISHGVNKKSSIAIIGTLVALVLTTMLAMIFINTSNLTGVDLHEIETLLYVKEGMIDLRGILIAGILMGTLGVIDDVAMTQSSIVSELKKTNPKLTWRRLNIKAMNVGRDHIASVVNTLILVYVGGSLTTLLLFTEFPRPLLVLINSEVVSLQITVALIGSIGLILTVPITTLIASWIATKFPDK